MREKAEIRNFRIVSVSKDDGVDFEKNTFKGVLQPIQAAKKAFNNYCKKSGLIGCVRRFSIEEITKGKPRRQFHYVGTRKKSEIEQNGSIKYELNIRKAK